MTLVNASDGFRRYVNPGTEGDGYQPPEWQSPNGWFGTRGSWFYIFPATADLPEIVYMFDHGDEDEVAGCVNVFETTGHPAGEIPKIVR